MARVTSDEVKEIIETSLTDISAFITSANLIVTNVLSEEGLGTSTLKEIERWLAAHLVAIRDPKVKSEKAGDGAAVYEMGTLGKGLDFTSFGQQVKLLDTSGKLANLGRIPAKLKAVDIYTG